MSRSHGFQTLQQRLHPGGGDVAEELEGQVHPAGIGPLDSLRNLGPDSLDGVNQLFPRLAGQPDGDEQADSSFRH